MNILVIDVQAILSKAIFAFEESGFRTSKGVPTYGVFGFFKMLIKEVRSFNPNLILCCNDTYGSFRKKISSSNNLEYKKGRGSSEFRHFQNELLVACLEEIGIPVLSVPGYEADDVIATVTRLSNKIFLDSKPVINPNFKIITVDKDLLQLVRPGVQVYLTKSNIWNCLISTKDECKKEVGVYPDQILDFKSLVGDKSDNIPGITNFGPKTAEKFFNAYYSFDDAKSDNFSKLPERYKQRLIKYELEYRTSKFFATLYNIPSFKLELTEIKNQSPTILVSDLECVSLGKDLINLNYTPVSYQLYGNMTTPEFNS